MGEVYRAVDTRLQRQVAIKVLPEAVRSDPERVARFEREAKLLASLNHPNIAGIHGLDQANARIGLQKVRSPFQKRCRSPTHWRPLTRQGSFTAGTVERCNVRFHGVAA
jgi:serine/threonine protein kinase